MSPIFISDSGFMADGQTAPSIGSPRDWFIWHFTHIDNLPDIAAANALNAAADGVPRVDVGDTDVKALRRGRPVHPDSDYPSGRFVSDHVPFYFAAKSPMLYVVSHGHAGYRGGGDPLVFLGVKLGHLVDSGVIWCASDRNAAAGTASFSREVDDLGSFVDFDLLQQKYWNRIPDDTDRPTRRAAEVLVLGSLPLFLISAVVARSETRLEWARRDLAGAAGSRQYWVIPEFYY